VYCVAPALAQTKVPEGCPRPNTTVLRFDMPSGDGVSIRLERTKNEAKCLEWCLLGGATLSHGGILVRGVATGVFVGPNFSLEINWQGGENHSFFTGRLSKGGGHGTMYTNQQSNWSTFAARTIEGCEQWPEGPPPGPLVIGQTPPDNLDSQFTGRVHVIVPGTAERPGVDSAVGPSRAAAAIKGDPIQPQSFSAGDPIPQGLLSGGSVIPRGDPIQPRPLPPDGSIPKGFGFGGSIIPRSDPIPQPGVSQPVTPSGSAISCPPGAVLVNGQCNSGGFDTVKAGGTSVPGVGGAQPKTPSGSGISPAWGINTPAKNASVGAVTSTTAAGNIAKSTRNSRFFRSRISPTNSRVLSVNKQLTPNQGVLRRAGSNPGYRRGDPK
jgi:hypothetical protein